MGTDSLYHKFKAEHIYEDEGGEKTMVQERRYTLVD